MHAGLLLHYKTKLTFFTDDRTFHLLLDGARYQVAACTQCDKCFNQGSKMADCFNVRRHYGVYDVIIDT